MEQLAINLSVIGVGWLLLLWVFLRFPLIYRKLKRKVRAFSHVGDSLWRPDGRQRSDSLVS